MTCNPSAFLNFVPAVLDADPEASKAAILRRWTPSEIGEILSTPDDRAAQLAARCLGLVGDWTTCEALVAVLDRGDPELVEAVESALWMIWTRAASPGAVDRLHRATRRLKRNDDQGACDDLAALVADEPNYAEAHHVYGLALQGTGDLDAAREQFAQAARLNAYHYAAHANLGHLAVEGMQFGEALRHYRRALEIHPGLRELREVMPMLERAVMRRDVA